MMNKRYARGLVTAINQHVQTVGLLLLQLKEGEGWLALGYTTWTECLENEFVFSRKHLYELMKAAPVQERLSPGGYTLTTGQATLLAKYPVPLQPVIVQIAHTRYGKLTESNLGRVADVLMQAVQTGYVNTGDGGNSTAFDAALSLEDQEAAGRARQRMSDSSKRRLLWQGDVIGENLYGILYGIELEIDTQLDLRKNYRVVIYEPLLEKEMG